MWNGDESCALSVLNAVQIEPTEMDGDIFLAVVLFKDGFVEPAGIAFLKSLSKRRYKKLHGSQ
jgi:hypothetical protein